MEDKIDLSPVGEDIRAQVFELLKRGGPEVLNEIQDLLGWKDRAWCMPLSFMAQRLSIPYQKFLYMLNHDQILAKNRLKRKAAKLAATIEYVPYTSLKLNFSLILPKKWQVVSDGPVLPTGDLNDAIIKINNTYPEVVADPPGSLFILFRRSDLINLTKFSFWVSGRFTATDYGEYNGPSIDVLRLSLPSPMTALELLEMSKLPAHFVPTGSRPSKGFALDGLHGQKYFYTLSDDLDDQKKSAWRYLNIYLVDELRAWILSCYCQPGMFIRYRPVFDRLLGSFRRGKDRGSPETSLEN